MPEKTIDFAPHLESGESALAGGQVAAYNVLVDGKGAIRRRPGIAPYSFAPSTAIDGTNAINGITSYGDKLFVTTTGQNIFAVSLGSALNLSTSGYNSQLAAAGRPSFSLWRAPFIAIAAGQAAPQKVDPLTLASSRLGGSPPICTSIVTLSQRLIVDEGTSTATRGAFRYSDAGYPETWDALRRADTEADPDDIVMLKANLNELFAFCKRTVQVFTPDPNVIFSPNRSRRLGCIAPYSVVEFDEQFLWLEPKIRFVMSDGRNYQDVSEPISATLAGLTSLSDCFGYRVPIEQFDFLVETFPTDGKTFVFQPESGWSQWSKWTDGIGHTLFPVNAHYYWDERGINVVGLNDGRIAQLSMTATTDIDGTEIKAEVTTGYDDRGTSSMKTCNRVTLEIVRGFATTGNISLSWRDDGGSWNTQTRSLGGDHQQFIHFYSLGTYRTRQWKIEMTDAVDFTLARAIESFSVGTN